MHFLVPCECLKAELPLLLRVCCRYQASDAAQTSRHQGHTTLFVCCIMTTSLFASVSKSMVFFHLEHQWLIFLWKKTIDWDTLLLLIFLKIPTAHEPEEQSVRWGDHARPRLECNWHGLTWEWVDLIFASDIVKLLGFHNFYIDVHCTCTSFFNQCRNWRSLIVSKQLWDCVLAGCEEPWDGGDQRLLLPHPTSPCYWWLMLVRSKLSLII